MRVKNITIRQLSKGFIVSHNETDIAPFEVAQATPAPGRAPAAFPPPPAPPAPPMATSTFTEAAFSNAEDAQKYIAELLA